MRWYGYGEPMETTLDISAFKHVVVPIGVVIGLGVARIVSAAAAYTQHHERIRLSAAHVIWITVLFLWFVGLWWTAWNLRHVEADLWSFFALIFLLVGPCLMFMATSLILPDVPAEGELDLGKRLEALARPFFLVLACFVIWLAWSELWLLDEPWLLFPKRAFQATAVALLAIGGAFPTRKVILIIGVVTLPLVIVAFSTVRSKLG